MSVNRFTIRESDIMKYILKQLNTNSFELDFDYADFSLMGNEALMIQRLSFLGDNFDVKETFDDMTYITNKELFIPVNIPNLNGTFTATDDYKEVLYQTSVDFLVYSGDNDFLMLVQLAIEEVRARLIQYNDVMEVSYLNLDDLESNERIKESLKLVTMAGTIQYGAPETINGNLYTIFSMPIDVYVTNHGEFANQNRFTLGHSNVLEDGWVKTTKAHWDKEGKIGGEYDLDQSQFQEPQLDLFPKGKEEAVLRVKNKGRKLKWVENKDIVADYVCEVSPPTSLIPNDNELGKTCYSSKRELVWRKGSRLGWENSNLNNRDSGRALPNQDNHRQGFYFKIPVSYAYQYDFPEQWKHLDLTTYNPLGLNSVFDYIDRFGLVNYEVPNANSLEDVKRHLRSVEPLKPVAVVVNVWYRNVEGATESFYFWVNPYQYDEESRVEHDGWEYYYLDYDEVKKYEVIEEVEEYYTYYKWSKEVMAMLPFKPLTWNFATIVDIETTQTLQEYKATNTSLSSEVKAVPKSKSFGISFTYVVDLRDRLLRELYKDAMKQKLGVNLYKLRIETTQYNESTKEYEVQPDLTTERYYELVNVSTNEEFSKGSRMIFTITLFPTMRRME